MLKRVTVCALVATFLACSLVGAAPAPKKPGPPPKTDPTMVILQKAFAAHKAGKLDEAMADYKAVIKAKPGFTPVYMNMAQIYLQKKDFNSAIPLLLKVEQMQPKDPEVPSQLVRIFLFTKQPGKAVAQAKIAARLKAKDPIAYYALGQEAMQKKDYAAATRNLSKWVAAVPQDMGTRQNLAGAYMQTKQYKLALAEYQKLIAANPSDVKLREAAAFAAQKANNPAFAVKQFEAISKKDPNDPHAAMALAENYMRGNDPANLKKAKTLFQKVERKVTKEDPMYYEAIFNLGIIGFLQNQFGEAKANFTEAAKIRPKDPTPKLNIALAETQLKEYDNAIKHYQAVIKLDPKNDKAVLGLVDVYKQKKDFDKSRETLQKLQARYPKDPGPSIEIAGTYIEEGKTDDAAKQLEDVLKKFPKNQRAMMGLADIYRRQGKSEEAVKQLETLQSITPDLGPTKMIAEVYMQEYRTDKARECYDKVLAKDSKDQDALKGKAYSFEREGEPSAAKGIGAWQQYRAAYPTDPLSYERVAALYGVKKNPKAAIKELKDATAKFPKNREVAEQLAAVYRDNKQYDEAIAAWQDIAKRFPEAKKDQTQVSFGPSLTPTDQIADILAEQKKFDDARAQYKPMLDKNPKDPAPYKGMARIYLKEQRYDDAIAQWNKVKELTASANEQERDEPYSQIANIYKTQAITAKDAAKAAFYDKAADEFKSLIAKDPKSRMGMGSLAGVYYDAKKYDEAITQLRALSAAYPADAKMMGITDQIARIYTEQSKYDEAINEYVTVLKKDPKDESALAGLGRVYTEKKDPEPQVAAWRKLIEISPDKVDVQVDAYNQIANFYMQQEKEDLAAKEYVEIVKLKPADVHTILTLARLYEKKQKFEEALEQYRAAAKINPLWRVDAARILQNLGKTEEAKTELAAAMKADPKLSYPHSSLGKIYETEGKADQAEAEYRTAIKLDKSNYEATSNLMRMMEKQGKLDEAAMLQKQLSAGHPELANPMDYARSLEKAGRIDDAAAEFAKQIEKQPKYAAQLRAELGRMLIKNARYDAAIKVYTEMSKDKQESIRVDGTRGLADTHAKQGKTDLAISEYKQVLKVYPSYPQVIDQVQSLYASQGKDAEFLAYMKQLVTVSTTSAPYDFMMEKFKAAGKSDEGLSYLNTLAIQRPTDDNLKVSIAHWSADAGQFDKAIDIYKKLITDAKQDPGPGIHIALADLYDKAGKTTEAIDEYKKTVEQSGSPEVRFKYATLLEKANQKPDALEQYKKILQMDPLNEAALKGMRAIDPNAKVPDPIVPPGGPGMPPYQGRAPGK